jgi:hypothetical protein
VTDQRELTPVESFRRRPDVIGVIYRRVSRRARLPALIVFSQVEPHSRVVMRLVEQRAPQSAVTGIAVSAE